MQENGLYPQKADPYEITDHTNESNNLKKTLCRIPPMVLYLAIRKHSERHDFRGYNEIYVFRQYES